MAKYIREDRTRVLDVPSLYEVDLDPLDPDWDFCDQECLWPSAWCEHHEWDHTCDPRDTSNCFDRCTQCGVVNNQGWYS